MRFLITGGAGFIGSHLSEFLISKGHYVTILDDLSTGRESNIVHLKSGKRFNAVFDKVENSKITDNLVSETDYIIHLAAAVGVKLIVEEPVRTIHTNIRGTEVILEAALKYKLPIFIASTSEVYGKLDKFPFTEDDDCVYGTTTKARWSYAVSKAIDEYLGLAYYKNNNLKVIISRFFNTVGPRQIGRYGMVLPRFIKAALNNEELQVYGDGTQRRCFGFVTDVVKSIYRLINSDEAYGEIINIGNNEEISILDLARKVVSICQSRSKIKIVPYNEIYGHEFEDMKRRVPSIAKLEDLTDYRFKTSIDEIIKITAAYIQKEEI